MWGHPPTFAVWCIMLRSGYCGRREEFSMLALRPHQIQHMEPWLFILAGGEGWGAHDSGKKTGRER